MNSQNDCLDVWRAVLDSQDALVEDNNTSDFQATYNGNETCTYTYNKQPTLTVDYDSNTGNIVIAHTVLRGLSRNITIITNHKAFNLNAR